MAEVKSFKYGENIIVHHETKKVEVDNPIADISLDIIPTHITFSAVCVISDFDYKNSSIIGYNLKYKGDISLYEEKMEIEPWQPATPEDNCSGLVIWIDFRNILLEKEGILETEIYFNDGLIGTFPINVMRKRV